MEVATKYGGRRKVGTDFKGHVVGLGSKFVPGRPLFWAVERKVRRLRAWITYCMAETVFEGRKRRGWQAVGMRDGRLGAGRELLRQVPSLCV